MKFVIALAALVAVAYAGVPTPRDGPKCTSPNGQGLPTVLKEFVDLLPVEELAGIYLTAVSSDEEVQKVIAYLESEDFHNFLRAIAKAPEFDKLVSYACKELYFDFAYYYNVVAGILGLPPLDRPFELDDVSARRPGLVGMIEDMIDVIPVYKIKDLFEEKLQKDPLFKKAIEFLKSADFQKMVKVVEGLPESQHIAKELRGMGVDVDALYDAVKRFLGWN